MSGHTDFSLWIKNKAKYLFTKDEPKRKKKIIDVFFISSEIPNSDEMVIQYDEKKEGDEIDFSDLRKRSSLQET